MTILVSESTHFINLSKNTAYILRTPQTRLLAIPSYYLIYKTSQKQHERLPIGKNAALTSFSSFCFTVQFFLFSRFVSQTQKTFKNHQVTQELFNVFSFLPWLSFTLAGGKQMDVIFSQVARTCKGLWVLQITFHITLKFGPTLNRSIKWENTFPLLLSLHSCSCGFPSGFISCRTCLNMVCISLESE